METTAISSVNLHILNRTSFPGLFLITYLMEQTSSFTLTYSGNQLNSGFNGTELKTTDKLPVNSKVE